MQNYMIITSNVWGYQMLGFPKQEQITCQNQVL